MTTFSRAYFEQMAALEDTHPWTQSMRALTLALLKKNGNAPPQRILDVGCGTGGFLREWQAASQAEECVGIDLFAEALAFAKSRCSADWAVASAAALPFEGAVFAAIHCADVLQHMKVQDSEFALNEFRRALMPGGLLALRVRASRSLGHDDDSDYSHSFTPDGLQRTLRGKNFEVLFLSRVNALPSLWAEIRGLFSSPHSAHAPVKHIAHRPQADCRTVLLQAYLRMERYWNSMLPMRLPWGHTILCIARLKD
jgi:SAM-dependent methyltransferase